MPLMARSTRERYQGVIKNYLNPAFGSTQQIAVSPAITPASPGLYSGFASVLIVFRHVINDTQFDK